MILLILLGECARVKSEVEFCEIFEEGSGTNAGVFPQFSTDFPSTIDPSLSLTP
jgi:hypothetical protein